MDRWTIKITTSAMNKNAVKKGTISAGEKVEVFWGKGKTMFSVEVVDDGSGPLTSEVPS